MGCEHDKRRTCRHRAQATWKRVEGRLRALAAAAEEMMLGLLNWCGGQPESNPFRLVLLPLLLRGSNMACGPVCVGGGVGSGCGVCACFLCWRRKTNEGESERQEVGSVSISRVCGRAHTPSQAWHMNHDYRKRGASWLARENVRKWSAAASTREVISAFRFAVDSPTIRYNMFPKSTT